MFSELSNKYVILKETRSHIKKRIIESISLFMKFQYGKSIFQFCKGFMRKFVILQEFQIVV